MTSVLYFTLLLFSGLWALGSSEFRQFIVVKEKKNWTEAQTYCRKNYTDLATIESQEEMKTVNASLQGETGHFWTGLRGNSSMWVWSDGRNLSYDYWNTGEPNNDVVENCVQILTEAQQRWNDAACKWPDPFVCYTRIPLVLIKENKTWTEAVSYCRENHEDLASVHNTEIQDWVETVIKNASTPRVWMGLCYTCTLGFWFWVNGNYFCYQNWAAGNRVEFEDCSSGDRTGAVESGSNQWVSLSPNDKLNFICSTK